MIIEQKYATILFLNYVFKSISVLAVDGLIKNSDCHSFWRDGREGRVDVMRLIHLLDYFSWI